MYRSWIPTPPILCLRFAAYLTIGLAQDSRPSGSLVLTRKALSSSTPSRFIPAHQNRDSAHRHMLFGDEKVHTCEITYNNRLAGNQPATYHFIPATVGSTLPTRRSWS